jgi:hypothetical protein
MPAVLRRWANIDPAREGALIVAAVAVAHLRKKAAAGDSGPWPFHAGTGFWVGLPNDPLRDCQACA